eukprot:scaffold8055_cov156-Cylindrotheca_fusiformis.AAC.4
MVLELILSEAQRRVRTYSSVKFGAVASRRRCLLSGRRKMQFNSDTHSEFFCTPDRDNTLQALGVDYSIGMISPATTLAVRSTLAEIGRPSVCNATQEHYIERADNTCLNRDKPLSKRTIAVLVGRPISVHDPVVLFLPLPGALLELPI